MLKIINPSNSSKERLIESYEDLDKYISRTPQKKIELDDFLDEFEQLVSIFKIDMVFHGLIIAYWSRRWQAICQCSKHKV